MTILLLLNDHTVNTFHLFFLKYILTTEYLTSLKTTESYQTCTNPYISSSLRMESVLNVFPITIVFLFPFSSSFLNKFYVLSSQEALQKFMVKPRWYLLPPMPRPPCKVSVIGPPQSGKSTLCSLLAEHYGAVVMDIKKLKKVVMEKIRLEMMEQARQDATISALEKVKVKDDVNKSGES